MIDIKLPKIWTKLACDIEVPQHKIDETVTGKTLDLRETLWQRVKVWKKLSNKKVLCKIIWGNDDTQYVIEVSNVKWFNTIAPAINKWIYGKQEILEEKYKWKDVRYSEKVYFSNPRIYEIKYNTEIFRLDLRIAKLREMWSELLHEKKREVKRNGRMETILVENWLLEELVKLNYEKTIESDRDIAEHILRTTVNIFAEVETHPPEPVQTPFYFRKKEVLELWDHLLKLCRANGKEDNKSLIDLDSVMDFLEDNFEEIVTKKEIEKIYDQMKRKARKVAKQFYTHCLESDSCEI